MNIIQWYAVALAAPTALSISFYVLGISIGILRTYATHHFLKHVFYARVHKYIRGTTRYHALLIAALLGGNALCLTIRTHGRAEILRRAGLLSTLNLVPLALGSHMNSIVNCCGLGYDAYGAIHRWIGRVAVIEGVIHVILAVNLERPSLHSSIQVAAVVVGQFPRQNKTANLSQAASAMATILITSFSIVRHHFYEVFLNLHRVLVVVLIVAIWLHVPGKLLNIPTIYLLVVCCLWASLQLLRTCQILYRNFRHWKYSCKVAIAPLPDAYQVHAKIPRSWKYRAGQYVYLCLPGVSYSAILQSHPYMIAWWYRYDTAQDIVVFIIQRRMGFTHSLPTDSRAVRAIIEGPFGNEIHLDDYGTVLLFATGIGIAGQLLYVRQLLENFHNHDAKARRVALFWQVDSEGGTHLI